MAIDDLNIPYVQGLPDGEPVIMLNLIRLRETAADGNGSGWDAYSRYSALTMPMIKARGGTILWAGKGQAVSMGDPNADGWDFAVLVRYPSKHAFLDMMTSKEYADAANPQRLSGTIKHVIVAMTETYSKLRI